MGNYSNNNQRSINNKENGAVQPQSRPTLAAQRKSSVNNLAANAVGAGGAENKDIDSKLDRL